MSDTDLHSVITSFRCQESQHYTHTWYSRVVFYCTSYRTLGLWPAIQTSSDEFKEATKKKNWIHYFNTAWIYRRFHLTASPLNHRRKTPQISTCSLMPVQLSLLSSVGRGMTIDQRALTLRGYSGSEGIHQKIIVSCTQVSSTGVSLQVSGTTSPACVTAQFIRGHTCGWQVKLRNRSFIVVPYVQTRYKIR